MSLVHRKRQKDNSSHFGGEMSKFFTYTYIFYCILGSGVHVKNMQNCCIGTYMAMQFAASIPPSPISGISPFVISPQPPYPLLSLLIPPNRHNVWCSPPCVHVFSLFNTHLWVRTCGVWFSVLVSVCWEWWFPDSSMFLQGTQTHHFLWLHSIPWYKCATFSLSSLSSMGIWVCSRSLLL